MWTLSRTRRQTQRRRTIAGLLLGALLATPAIAQERDLAELIRGKTPDRDIYQPPTLSAPTAPAVPTNRRSLDQAGHAGQSYRSDVAQVAYEEQPVILRGPVRQAGVPHVPMAQGVQQAGAYHPSGARGYRSSAVHSYAVETSCGSEFGCDGGFCGCDSGCGCDGGYCDGGGCDSLGCGPARPMFGDCRDSNLWFGSAELMLLFRSGDRLPVLATGGATAATTRPLFGGEKYYDDMTPGARFMLGTWLDYQRCNSVVFRGWGTGKETFSFGVDGGTYAVIERPFLNVTPGSVGNDALVIGDTANGRNGALSIRGSSEVYGADIALHRTWRAGLGGVIELLYGYQHMRLTEDLEIANNVLSNPLLTFGEFFEADNEFHGGEVGIATRYREGCWSFNGMFKLAGGSLQRTATLNSTSQDGLLVRASNRGTFRDSTFGWIPELNLSLGYRYTQNLDFTVGYHLIAMSDALQVSGILDPQMAVNEDYPTVGPARPAVGMKYGTFTAQSVTIGLQYVY